MKKIECTSQNLMKLAKDILWATFCGQNPKDPLQELTIKTECVRKKNVNANNTTTIISYLL